MVSQNPDDLMRELEGIEFEGDAGTLTALRDEANLTVERQLDALADIDDKASRMLRLNALVVGVVVSALSIASELADPSGAGVPVLEQFRNGYVELGLASLVLSTALAAMTYTVTEYDGGVSAENVKRLLRLELPLDEVGVILVKNYAARINFNRSSNLRNIPLITATIVFAVTGVVCFSLGVYQAAIRPVPWWLATGAILVVGAVVYASGLVRQTRRAIQDVREWQ